MNAPFKRCGCGREYTEAQWLALPYKGEQLTEDETGRYRLEMRDCACLSTLGIEVRLGDAEVAP